MPSEPAAPGGGAVEALVAQGLLVREEHGLATTRRWQAAMARAAARLYAAEAPWQDLRLPIALALAELVAADDDTLVGYVEVMLGVESAALRRTLGGAGAVPR
jgi:kynureninase